MNKKYFDTRKDSLEDKINTIASDQASISKSIIKSLFNGCIEIDLEPSLISTFLITLINFFCSLLFAPYFCS